MYYSFISYTIHGIFYVRYDQRPAIEGENKANFWNLENPNEKPFKFLFLFNFFPLKPVGVMVDNFSSFYRRFFSKDSRQPTSTIK